MSEADVEALIALHLDLMTLILRQQLDNLRDGVPAASQVAVTRLTRGERARLRGGLKRLATVVSDIRGLMAA